MRRNPARPLRLLIEGTLKGSGSHNIRVWPFQALGRFEEAERAFEAGGSELARGRRRSRILKIWGAVQPGDRRLTGLKKRMRVKLRPWTSDNQIAGDFRMGKSPQ